jgi:hypothetical protein
VRAGYHTIRYDHSDNREPISIETVLKRVRIILDERNEANVVVFCAENIRKYF